MVLGIPDPDSALDLGKGILAAVKKFDAPRDWPNVHESLVELYAILNEWCDAAEASNETIRRQIDQRRLGSATGDSGKTFHSGAQSGTLVFHMTSDVNDLLRPDAPWFQRWSSSKRRAAARRSLASILAVYAPELIRSFDEATSDRASWVKRRDEELVRWLSEKPSIDDEDVLIQEMEATLSRLTRVRYSLGEFINTHFPLGVPAEST